MARNIVEIVREKGLLLDKSVFELLKSFDDFSHAVTFLESLEKVSGEKMITRGVLSKNVEFVRSMVGKLRGEEKEVVENTFVRLGISLEIRKETSVVLRGSEKEDVLSYEVFCADTNTDKKLEVKDFVGNFRSRYEQLRGILISRPELQSSLMGINKISNERQSLGIIGIVTEKRTTKNKNLMIKFEDLTGEIAGIVKQDSEVFSKADELQLDDVVGVRASGNSEMLFVHDIFYPDSFKQDRVKFDNDCWVVFLSDLHCGSGKHLGDEFQKFLKWINEKGEIQDNIKYVFFTGDNVDGVGIFPGQESELNLKSMEEQYGLVSNYLKQIPKRITMFMCPGQHDAVRVAEPQPIISKKYAGVLHDIDNLVLVTSPSRINLIEGKNKVKILMYHGVGLNSIINEIPELREVKAYSCPARAVRHLLKRRHLAPSHSNVVYIPNAEKDSMVISEVPDIICTGDIHRLDVDNYNGVLIVCGSCWQLQTSFEEKMGHIPDICKVPLVNLKTREIKILDFSGGRDAY